MRALVNSHHDNRRWDIPLCAFNTHQVDVNIGQPRKQGLTKNELRIGEQVGFADNSGVEHTGEVIRLNQKNTHKRSSRFYRSPHPPPAPCICLLITH